MFNYTENNSKTQPFFNQKGKVIGKLENGVLKKIVRGSVHMLQKPKGWAWDKHVIEETKILGGKSIEITDTETQTKYKAKLDDFEFFGIAFNRGYGEQIVLPIKYWSIIKDDVLQLSLI